MAKFDNISDEVLAAYIDGNATFEEQQLIESSFTYDNSFVESVDVVRDIIELDERSELRNIEYDRFFFEEDSIEETTNEILTIQTIESMKTTSYNIWGEGGENIKDPVYVQQPDDHSCALRSQQLVLRDFGIDIPFEKLEEMAKEYGVYSDDGTYTYDIGKVLEIAGVNMHQVEGSTLLDLSNELALGHRVIVSVDAHELWYNGTIPGKLNNWFNDAIGNQGGNHALIVAGIEVNPDDTKDVKVVLTDPGSGDLRIEYPLDQFMDAWKDSNCFMAATDNAAPYQYDASSGMEIPSNFVVQQYVNDFIISNGYQLSPDLINIPEEYNPAFTGHLDMVGDIDYDSFNLSYQEMLDNRLLSSMSIKEQIEKLAETHTVNNNSDFEDNGKENDPEDDKIDIDDNDGDDDSDSDDNNYGDDDGDDNDDNDGDDDGDDNDDNNDGDDGDDNDDNDGDDELGE